LYAVSHVFSFKCSCRRTSPARFPAPTYQGRRTTGRIVSLGRKAAPPRGNPLSRNAPAYGAARLIVLRSNYSWRFRVCFRRAAALFGFLHFWIPVTWIIWHPNEFGLRVLNRRPQLSVDSSSGVTSSSGRYDVWSGVSAFVGSF
jgi:hypothetical protein